MARKARKTTTSTEVKNRWNRKNYDQLNVFVSKGSRELIKSLAAKRGMSLNSYIKHLIIADNAEIPDISGKIGGGGNLTVEKAIKSIIESFQVVPPKPPQ